MSKFTNLSELHKLSDLLVIEGAVLSIVLTNEVLKGRKGRKIQNWVLKLLKK